MMGDMADYANSMLGFSQARRTLKTPYPASEYSNNVLCPKCGNSMELKFGAYGQFFGCTNFPKCNGSRGVVK